LKNTGKQKTSSLSSAFSPLAETSPADCTILVALSETVAQIAIILGDGLTTLAERSINLDETSAR
jgi:hypothetical protein